MVVSNIGRGAIISYLSISLNILLSFVYTPWMLHKIGASDYGLYSLILSFISYFTIDFGLTSSIARFVAKYRAEGNHHKVENIMGLTLWVFIVIDVIIFLCLLICYFYITEIFKGLTPVEIEKLKVLYIIAGTFSIMSFVFKPLDGALTAYEYFVPAKVLDMVYKVGSVALVVVALLLGGNIYMLVLINGALSFIVHIYRYFYWCKKTGLRVNMHFYEKSEMKSITSFSSWAFLIGLAQRFRLNLIPSVLGIFSNSTQIAVFALGMTMEAMIWTLSSALNGLFLPKVSQMVHANNREGILGLMIRVGRIQLFIVFFIFSGFFVFGQEFIKLWVGVQYSDVYMIVLFLIFSNVIANTLQVANDLIYAEGKIKYTARPVFITSFLGLCVSCIVAKDFGAIGCAACSGLALVFTQISFLRIYKKKMNIDIVFFIKQCHYSILPLLLVIAVIFYCVFNKIHTDGWLLLFICAMLYSFVFVLVSYFILFNDYEKSLVKSIINIKR